MVLSCMGGVWQQANVTKYGELQRESFLKLRKKFPGLCFLSIPLICKEQIKSDYQFEIFIRKYNCMEVLITF